MIKILLVLFAIHCEARAAGLDEAVFARAKRENKLVLLDLEAIWCHWCHVMDQETYANPAVKSELDRHFILVKVDQDSAPDLARLYEDYGWPATVIFNATAKQLDVRSGFVAPDKMQSWLSGVWANPKPPIEAATVERVSLDDQKLRAQIESNYDSKLGGWTGSHKYLDRYFIEDQTRLALRGDKLAERRVRQTLDAARALIDPKGGGAYQYSVGGHWTEPHFEKIMSYQADYVRAYALAYAAWRDPRDLESARAIVKFFDRSLINANGAFYTSQDADEGHRIDRHVYARENAWAAQALLELYAVTGDSTLLALAEKALGWIEKNRRRTDGLFNHGEDVSKFVYLSDQLAMAQAFLAHYQATTEPESLDRAAKLLRLVAERFASKAGFVASAPDGVLKSKPNSEENIALARLAALVSRYQDDPDLMKMAEHALAWTEKSEEADRIYLACGLLQARHELHELPLHIAVVGARKEAATLYAEALAYPETPKLIERIDPGATSPASKEIHYPKLSGAAVFVCTGTRCSIPMRDNLRERLDRTLSRSLTPK